MKRQEAKDLGLDKYNTGKPCKRGHFADRYTKSAQCIECVRIQSVAWRLENPEKHSRSMREAYKLAKLRTEMFGFIWEVDHVIPLRGDIVSGLHVPTNLQVIPKSSNREKRNHYLI